MNPPCDQPESMADSALFDVLYGAHYRSLYAYLLGHTAESETATDLLQEVFVRVWRHISEARCIPCERRCFWLFAIARNLLHDHHRRRTVRRRYEAAMPEADLAADAASDPARTVEQREMAAAVEAAIARLPVVLRTVLTMHLVGGMTSIEIGAALDKPPGTIRYQILQARKRLARDLGLKA